MLSNEYTITVDAVAFVCTRVNQDNYGSVYRGENGLKELTLTIKHTIPPRGKPGESHLIRLDLSEVDTEGAFVGTTSAWCVVKTADRIQDTVQSQKVGAALSSFLVSDSGNTVLIVDRVVKRES